MMEKWFWLLCLPLMMFSCDFFSDGEDDDDGLIIDPPATFSFVYDLQAIAGDTLTLTTYTRLVDPKVFLNDMPMEVTVLDRLTDGMTGDGNMPVSGSDAAYYVKVSLPASLQGEYELRVAASRADSPQMGELSLLLGYVYVYTMQADDLGEFHTGRPAWVDLSDTNIIKIDGTALTGAQFWSQLALAAGSTFTRYSRGNQFWAMNSKTYAQLKSKLITFTATGDIVANLFGTLPIVNGDIDVLEFIPDGDIIGGYGDLYLWVDRASMQIESSREVQFIQDNTVFRGKSRADGAPIIPGAFVAININNTEVTTVMDFAADTANDADLNTLSVGTETLSPGTFDPDVTTYTLAAAANASDKIEAAPAQASAEVEITYNGKNIRNGGTITWLADDTAHPLTITVRNGNAVKVYTVNVTRASA